MGCTGTLLDETLLEGWPSNRLTKVSPFCEFQASLMVDMLSDINKPLDDLADLSSSEM